MVYSKAKKKDYKIIKETEPHCQGDGKYLHVRALSCEVILIRALKVNSQR
jgi:hypothetical protein